MTGGEAVFMNRLSFVVRLIRSFCLKDLESELIFYPLSCLMTLYKRVPGSSPNTREEMRVPGELQGSHPRTDLS